MTEVRDWHKDRSYLETVSEWEMGIGDDDKDYLCEIGIYWLQQYANEANQVCYWKGEAAAEKERADTLLGANQMYQVELAESLGREAKLREAIEEALSWALNCGEYTVTEVIAILRGVLESLYPEEGEAT